MTNQQAFPQILLSNLKLLRVNLLDNKGQIVRLVDQIMNNKQINRNFSTSHLELEIDRLVYQLYGLTEEEIKIVEG